jgi:hypothetical protein
LREHDIHDWSRTFIAALLAAGQRRHSLSAQEPPEIFISGAETSRLNG